ncbi:hypothetical protein [Candidatus Endoriftia persephonae]|jgi:hypothetical protein|uniref:Uncharacterized protein n=2 Tax=Gammaproteobacteria TaxID=1236 RepID=G2FED8_9GAMM|nr:hypothetical protein [Candidatus Endoriftia persephone]EGW54908.1 hypothetical protein TevJSym_ah00880 [endosymbiont of Tevnia jerichonana (vent Tica)]USF89114.1 hypothetical protein L0Y14_07760 [Candidatus Endoriftia persephone]
MIVLMTAGCGGSSGEAVVTNSGDLSDIIPYQTAGRYSSVLKGCVDIDTILSSCLLSELPLIGQQSDNPDIATIMERVLVSHQWMGQRFEAALALLPVETLKLFRSVTAIVIDSDIRPSHYRTSTAAIYLDPAYLWLTNAEKADISKQEDYRTDFGADLSFDYLWRYVSGSSYAYESYDLNGTEERTLDDIRLPLSRLLYHELAHAADFAPPDRIASLNPSISVYETIRSVENDWLSNRLYRQQPLVSQELDSIASVLYDGQTADQTQQQMEADYAGALLQNDGANHLYSYYTQYEDLAMLFEAALMKHYDDIDMDIAFAGKPAAEEPVCEDYLVGWGERNRIAAESVKGRAEFAAESILPGATDWSVFFATIVGMPQSMVVGEDWCANLTLGTGARSIRDDAALQNLAKRPINPQDRMIP